MDQIETYTKQLLTIGALIPIFYYTERMTRDDCNLMRPCVKSLLIGIIIGEIAGKQFLSPLIILTILLIGYMQHTTMCYKT